MNYCVKNRVAGHLHALVVCVAFACAMSAKAVDLTGVVTLDGSPLRSALVKVETPRQTIVATTDATGVFKALGLQGPKAVVSVTAAGRVVYRNIVDVSNQPLKIALFSSGQLPRGLSPAALAVFQANEVYIADRNGRIYRHQSGNTIQIADLGSATDIAVARVGGQTKIFVASGGSACRVLELTPAGKQENTWFGNPVQDRCGGLTVDPSDGTIYVADAKTAAVYRLPPGNRIAGLTAKLSMQEIGPVAFDVAGRRLAVADASAGRIFFVNPGKGSSRELAKGLGEIRALAVDTERKCL